MYLKYSWIGVTRSPPGGGGKYHLKSYYFLYLLGNSSCHCNSQIQFRSTLNLPPFLFYTFFVRSVSVEFVCLGFWKILLLGVSHNTGFIEHYNSTLWNKLSILLFLIKYSFQLQWIQVSASFSLPLIAIPRLHIMISLFIIIDFEKRLTCLLHLFIFYLFIYLFFLLNITAINKMLTFLLANNI